ncbi:hypothetical protein DFH11DRAFT_174449 [Phellopilus nigrolimitatus]|nr:hypothetical protein DFH11DRAFT_174449 [Phellopilus nigrolimitatus]
MFDPLTYPPRADERQAISPRPLPTLPSAPSASSTSPSTRSRVTVGTSSVWAASRRRAARAGERHSAQRTASSTAEGPAHAEPAAALGAEAEGPLLPCVSRVTVERVGLERHRARQYRTLYSSAHATAKYTKSILHMLSSMFPTGRTVFAVSLTNNLNDDGLGDESLTRPNVKCTQCTLPLRNLRVGGYMFELQGCWLAWKPRC